MRIKTSLRAGRAEGHGGGTLGYNHNQTAVRSSEGLRVKSSVRAGHIGGSLGYNHNQTTVRAVRVKSNVKAGFERPMSWDNVKNQHNQTLVRAGR